jgi:Na+/proline symporter
MQYTALNTIGFVDVPKTQTAAASAITSMLFQLNAGFGIALGALAVRASAALGGRASATIADFHAAFVFVALVALAGIVQCLRLPRDAGAEVSGHASAR